jgi:hypothetical protein
VAPSRARRLRIDQERSPLYSDQPPAKIAALVEAAGLTEPGVELLTDEVLWGGPQARPRYALSATKPR